MASGKHKTLTYNVGGAPLEVVYLDTAAAETLTVGSGAEVSGVINANFDVVVRLAASTPCYFIIAEDPEAIDSQATLFMPGYDHVPVPAGHKISVIKATGASDGVFNITPAVLT